LLSKLTATGAPARSLFDRFSIHLDRRLRLSKDLKPRIASATIKQFLAADQQIEQVRLVFFQPCDARVFLEYQEF
jgi:hypothetical protein